MISIEFKQNVETGDLAKIRSALLDYLIIDRSFNQFDEAFEYVQQLLNILQEYDGKTFEFNSEKWDVNYLNRQKVALLVNFSQNRIDHLKEVIKMVLSDNPLLDNNPVIGSCNKEHGTGKTVISEKRISQQSNSKNKRSDDPMDNIGTVMVISGLAVTVVGIGATNPFITGTGVVITGAGVVVKIQSKSRNNER